MVNQLLERFDIQERPTKQPKSKNEQVHKYRIKIIGKYVVPPPSTPKATKVKFSQEPPELQIFNAKDSVKKIEWSSMGTIWQQDKREKAKDALSQRTTATIPPINRAREQADWKEEKGEEKNEPTKRFPATILSTILSDELLSTILLDKLKSSAYKLFVTPRQREIATIVTAYLEAREARRKRSTNGNQIKLNHGPSDLTRTQEPLDLTSAERLCTQEFEWTTVKRGRKMKAAQRPSTNTIRGYDVEQPQSAQTEASPAVNTVKKNKVQQKADKTPSQAV